MPGAELQRSTTLFIPFSVSPHKLREADWAESCAEVILRRCPACGRDLIMMRIVRLLATASMPDLILCVEGLCLS